jgi:hypothetical protein
MASCEYPNSPISLDFSPDFSVDANDDDLLGLGLGLGASSPSPISPVAFGSMGKSMASSRRSTVQHDSFSSLASLMKAKKPYTPISPPTPRPSLSAVPNGELSTTGSKCDALNSFRHAVRESQAERLEHPFSGG